MRKAAVLGAVAGALTLGLVASSAAAAPVGSAALRIEPASAVEKVHSRCYRGDDQWRCRRFHHRHHRVGLFPFLLPFIVFGLAH
jgi:hypothetical protein